MKRTIIVTLVFAALIGTGSAFAMQPEYDTAVAMDRVYGEVVAPELINSVRPARIAVNNREIEGYITMEILVNEEGRVEHAKVLFRSSMFAVRNAVDAVARWKFEPATVNGIPTKALVAYNVPMGPRLEIFQDSAYGTQFLVDQPDGMAMLTK